MKIKTADLTGPALDWAVAVEEGLTEENAWTTLEIFKAVRAGGGYRYSTNWSQGGPLIEQECLDVRVFAEHGALDGGPYWISERHPAVGHGPTPLIAAMRCLVAATLGDEVDVPDELV